jgi:hypothetical protein
MTNFLAWLSRALGSNNHASPGGAVGTRAGARLPIIGLNNSFKFDLEATRWY